MMSDGSGAAPAAMHQAVHDGLPGAQERLSAYYQARYPEPGADPAASQPRPHSVGPAVDPRALRSDPDFDRRLRSDDWQIRDAANRELSAAYRTYTGSYAEQTPTAGQHRPDGPSRDQAGVPTSPDGYSLPEVYAEVPALGAALRTIVHDLRLPVPAASAFARRIEAMAERGPPSEATLAAQHEGLADMVTPAELSRATAAWARLAAASPALAAELEALGMTTDVATVRLLARAGR